MHGANHTLDEQQGQFKYGQKNVNEVRNTKKQKNPKLNVPKYCGHEIKLDKVQVLFIETRFRKECTKKQ